MMIVSQSGWLAQFNTHLIRNFGISSQEAGWEDSELVQRWGHMDPQSAVWSFDDKYDLTPLKPLY